MATTEAPAFVMPFGRHKGKPLSAIPAGYLLWALELPNLRADTRAAIAAHIKAPAASTPAQSSSAPAEPSSRPVPRWRTTAPKQTSFAEQASPAPCCAKCGLRGTEARPLVHEACATDDVPF